jgi:hypothetical protein
VHRQAMTTEEDSQRDRGDNNLCQTMTARHRRQKHPLQWGTAGGGRDTTTAVHRLPSAASTQFLQSSLLLATVSPYHHRLYRTS